VWTPASLAHLAKPTILAHLAKPSIV
jgi:hypothetical protein